MIKIRRLLKSFTYSFKGLRKIIQEEQNLKIQLIFGLIAAILGITFQVSRTEWMVLIISSTLVIFAEVLNSAVERVTDVLKPRINDYVKEIKDIMAAAVMISAISSVIIGIIVFYPYLKNILH
jgi:diacylglycerol kinase